MNDILNSILNAAYTPADRVAFKIGELEVAWYGIFITIGFIFAILFASLKLRFWYKVSYDPFLYFCLIGIPVSLLGGRLWSFIIGDAGKGGGNFFIEFWNFRQGGLAIQGAIVATVLAACIWFPLILRKPTYHVKTMDDKGNSYVRQVSMWVYADAIVPCILVGQIIGRWGNFFNQEVYGGLVEHPEVTMKWLKVLMPGVYDWMFVNGNFHHPLFLYESFFNFFIFIFIYVGCEFIKFRKCGDLAMLYFLLYGILRLCMEPLRNDEFKFVTSIVTSVLYIAFAIALLILNHLVISKHRNIKVLWMIYVKTKYHCFIKFKRTVKSNIPLQQNYGYYKKISFERKPEEMLFYNGL